MNKLKKTLTIEFEYDDLGIDFKPVSLNYKDINHSILAFCIASILYEEDKRKPCFSSHVAENIIALKGGEHGS